MGGTRFVGRHIVQELLARNVVVTIAAMVLVINATIDLACAALDPRTRA